MRKGKGLSKTKHIKNLLDTDNSVVITGVGGKRGTDGDGGRPDSGW